MTKESEPDNGYRKPNNCPYCGYFCDAATMTGDDKQIPEPGDLSFCIMCSGSSVFNDEMKLIKFDLNSVKDINERIRLKGIQNKMELFWDTRPEKDERREAFLKERDRRESLG